PDRANDPAHVKPSLGHGTLAGSFRHRASATPGATRCRAARSLGAFELPATLRDHCRPSEAAGWMRSKHLVLISRGFPPSAAVGARRVLRFARGLSDAGF